MSDHLKDTFLISKESDQQWLHHLPYGITDQDIKEYLIKEKNIGENQIEINQIIFEGSHAGYRVKIPLEHLEQIDVEKDKYWPPGWISKQYKNENQVYNDSKQNCRNFSHDMAPTTVKITKLKSKFPSEEDFKVYAKNQVKVYTLHYYQSIQFLFQGIKIEEITNVSYHFFVTVDKTNYSRVVDISFWRDMDCVANVRPMKNIVTK